MAGKRATAAEKQKRVDAIIDLITKGYSRSQILRYVTEKTDWNASERTIDDYLADAYQYFRQLSEFDKPQKIGEAVQRYETIINAAMRVQDYQRAISAQNALSKLLGLDAPPAVQTLKIQGIDLDLISQVGASLESRGMNPADVFNRMIARLATEDIEK